MIYQNQTATLKPLNNSVKGLITTDYILRYRSGVKARKLIILTFIMVTAFLSVSAQDVRVFWDTDFRGRSRVIDHDMSYLDEGWNDQISSIKVPAGFKIQVFENDNYQGRSIYITQDWNADGNNGWWNDRISSIRIINRPYRGGNDWDHRGDHKVVKGYDVRRVEYEGSHRGSFENDKDKRWWEKNDEGTFKFIETGRDEWSVYLKDYDRNKEIQLDLYQKKVIADPYGRKWELYRIVVAH